MNNTQQGDEFNMENVAENGEKVGVSLSLSLSLSPSPSLSQSLSLSLSLSLTLSYLLYSTWSRFHLLLVIRFKGKLTVLRSAWVLVLCLWIVKISIHILLFFFRDYIHLGENVYSTFLSLPTLSLSLSLSRSVTRSERKISHFMYRRSSTTSWKKKTRWRVW